MNIEIEDVYFMVQDAVRYFPENARKCRRPNTFRVFPVESDISLTSPNMGATACDDKTPYFFSRSWERQKRNPNNVTAELPAVTGFEHAAEMEGLFTDNVEGTYTIAFTAWDVYNTEKKKGCTACESRSINEIYSDTKFILLTVMKFLYGIVFATTSADATLRWYPEALLKQWKIDSVITSYEIKGWMKTRLNSANKRKRMYRVERPGEYVYGTAILLDIQIRECAQPEYSFNSPEFGILSHEAGCKNC